MKNKITVTVGIPAHNEEKNIEAMIRSILKQEQSSYILEKIIVVCDGCTDSTSVIADNLSKKYPVIIKYEDKKQTGKAQRLNQIYKMNQSELLLTLDADILLGSDQEIELLVRNFINNPKLILCTARTVPLEQSSIIGKISNFSFDLWQHAAQSYKQGRNINTCQGSVVMLNGSFSNKIRYPKNTITDQSYIFIKSIEQGTKFYEFEHKSTIYFKTVNTFEDFMLQGTRAIFDDKKNIYDLLGESTQNYYIIPLKYKLAAIFNSAFKNPLLTLLAIGLGYYIRMFPYKKNRSKKGKWHISKSTKILV